jgi:L-asparaginase / beta-aspartyl-peptidase
MKNNKISFFWQAVLLAAIFPMIIACSHTVDPERPEYVLVIHGGAGTITAEGVSAQQDSAYRAALVQALEAGMAVLHEGGSAIDAVVDAIMVLEDSPLFNAGKGSVYNEVGMVENDASIMSGIDLSAGAVGALINIKNPIMAARHVMDDGRHVFMIGEGARNFALSRP